MDKMKLNRRKPFILFVILLLPILCLTILFIGAPTYYYSLKPCEEIARTEFIPKVVFESGKAVVSGRNLSVGQSYSYGEGNTAGIVTLMYFDKNGAYFVISYPERNNEAGGDCRAFVPRE